MFELAQCDLEKDEATNPAAMTVQVVGTTPIVNYPGNGLWDPVPPEEPLGIDIEAVPDMTRVDRG
jgi:hypothetical protein